MHTRLLMWSLRERRRRHVLNAFIIAAAVAVVIVFTMVVLQMKLFVERAEGGSGKFGRIYTFPKLLTELRTEGIPLRHKELVEKIDGVTEVQTVKQFWGRFKEGLSYHVSGEVDRGPLMNPDLYKTTPAEYEAWKNDRTAAIVAGALAKNLNLHVGQTLEIPTVHGPFQLKIAGIAPNCRLANRVGVHFDYADEFTGRSGVGGLRVFTTQESVDRVAREIDLRTKNTEMPTHAVIDSDYHRDLIRRVAVVPAVLGFLGIFLLFTTAVTIANGMAITIRERRAEIATLRVMGYRKSTLVRLFLSEALVIALVGAALAIGLIAVWSRNGLNLSKGFPEMGLGWFAATVGAATAVALAIVGVLPSVISALRAPPAEALRDTA